MPKVGVIGGGSLGTALVWHLVRHRRGELYWWVRDPQLRELIINEGRNPRYLEEVSLPVREIKFVSSLVEIVDACEVICVAVPARFLPEAVRDWVAFHRHTGKQIWFSFVKGLSVYNGQVLTPSQWLESVLFRGGGGVEVAVVSGPGHAEEIVRDHPTFLACAGRSAETRQLASTLLSGGGLKVLPVCAEMVALEWAGVLKNIYAILAGICVGLNMGDNFLAVVVVNVLTELRLILEAMFGSRAIDVYGFACAGDLLATVYSQHSRNRLFGIMVGRGYNKKAALAELGMVPEGYYALEPAYQTVVEEKKIHAPLLSATYNVVVRNVAPVVELSLLLNNLYEKLKTK